MKSNLILAPLHCMPKWVWPSMKRYSMFFIRNSTLPSMHWKFAEHARTWMQNNQLPIKEDNSIVEEELLQKSHQENLSKCFIINKVCEKTNRCTEGHSGGGKSARQEWNSWSVGLQSDVLTAHRTIASSSSSSSTISIIISLNSFASLQWMRKARGECRSLWR